MAIALGISAVIAVIGIQNALQLQSQISQTFSRTVDWQHIHGLGIDPTDRTILYIATHGDFYHSHDGSPPFKVDIVRADYLEFHPSPVLISNTSEVIGLRITVISTPSP